VAAAKLGSIKQQPLFVLAIMVVKEEATLPYKCSTTSNIGVTIARRSGRNPRQKLADLLIDDSGENDILTNLAWGVGARRLFAEYLPQELNSLVLRKLQTEV
jgi:hypothetical protein